MTGACRICGLMLFSSPSTALEPISSEAFRELSKHAVLHILARHPEIHERFERFTSMLVDYLASLALQPVLREGLDVGGFGQAQHNLREQLRDAILMAQVLPVVVAPTL